MVALIKAVQDYQQALERVCQQVAASRTLEEFQSLADLCHQPRLWLSQPVETISTLKIEVAHFRRNYGRNESAAKWQRQRRGQPPVERKPNPLKGGATAGPSLIPRPLAATSSSSSPSLSPEIRGEIDSWIETIREDSDEEFGLPQAEPQTEDQQ